MALTQKRREERLKVLLARVSAGEDIAARDFAGALTNDELVHWKNKWQEQLEIRAEMKNKPAVVVEYEKRLKKAMFSYNKAEGYNGSTKKQARRDATGVATHTRLYRKAEALFERAFESLREAWEKDKSLASWFDRELRFDTGLDAINAPRVVTSKSLDKIPGRGYEGMLRTKRELKQTSLEAALQQIEDDKAKAAAGVTAEDEAAADAARLAALVRMRAFIKR